MLGLSKRFGLMCGLWVWAVVLCAQQKNDRDYLRSGNRLYRDSLYTKSEVDYRKAIEANSRSARAYFNLGNALLRQQKPKEAMESYEQAVKLETNKNRLSAMYHNMGVILQSQKQFAPAIECYKNALRRNPNDEESRYNLVLCQHQLKNNPQQDPNKNNDKDKEDGNSQNKNKDEKSEKKDQDKQKDKPDEQQKQQQKQEQRDPNKMSKENAEQLLNAVMQDEKATQERIKKATATPQRRRLEKQW